MAGRIQIKIEGDHELHERLKKLGARARASLLTAAQAGARVIEEDADRRAPGPYVIVGNERVEGGMAEVEIGPDRDHWYYRFFEFGATEHEIKGEPLAFQADGETVFAMGATHPGMSAQPFLRPAVDTQRNQAVSAVGRVFRAEIERLTRGG